ncbi:MAG: hypothetical protein NUV68_00460 [Caldiserica bacterium]|nr:hypothetical protein [Caldisericota bacterium]MDH7561832.1 hypothetical protein [Caldisericota bacterium]
MEAVQVKITAIVSFFLGLGLLIFSALGIILEWKGNFIPFLIFAVLLLVVAFFFFRESRSEKEEIFKSEEGRGGDDSEGV